jgi:hypothetical protein
MMMFAFWPCKRELDRSCLAARLGEPQRAGAASVFGRKGISCRSVIPLDVSLNSAAQIVLRKAMRGVNGSYTSGSDALKTWHGSSRKIVLSRRLLYAASILVWFYVLSNVGLGIAYPFQSMGCVMVGAVGC